MLCAIYDAVNALIEKYNPDAIAIEELFFNANTKTAINVAQQRGTYNFVFGEKVASGYTDTTPASKSKQRR